MSVVRPGEESVALELLPIGRIEECRDRGGRARLVGEEGERRRDSEGLRPSRRRRLEDDEEEDEER